MRCRVSWRLSDRQGGGVGSGFLFVDDCVTTAEALAQATSRLRAAGILRDGEAAIFKTKPVAAQTRPLIEQVRCVAVLAFFPWLAEMLMSYPWMIVPVVVVKVLVWWGIVSGGLWLEDMIAARRKGKGGLER